MSATVIVFPRGQLRANDRKTLSVAGFVAIEADDPSRVVTALPIASSAQVLCPDDFTMALLHAVKNSPTSAVATFFVAELNRRALLSEERRTQEPQA